MTTQQTVTVDSLGICEHCGIVVCIEDMPVEAIDAKWACPKCGKELTHKTFGYESGAGKRIRWVGPEGKWVEVKPVVDFDLGNFFVTSNRRGIAGIPIYRY